MKPNYFNKIPVLCDTNAWIERLIADVFKTIGEDYIILSSNTPIRSSWDHFKNKPKIIIHWENPKRSGGAIIEEILDINPNYPVNKNIIILTSNPTRDDIIYLNELNVVQIVPIRNKVKELEEAKNSIVTLYQKSLDAFSPQQKFWETINNEISKQQLGKGKNDALEAIESRLNGFLTKFPKEKKSAKYFDCLASIQALRNQKDDAIKNWKFSLEVNPNFFRAYNNLVSYYIFCNEYENAYDTMKYLQKLNNCNINRLVKMGDVKKETGDAQRAEHYYNLALDYDKYSSGALNGLAEIKFFQGNLEESRDLISKSHMAHQLAIKLNNMGIQMVSEGNYEQALEHYTRAQYVLPGQEKGPLLFYNISLCYAKWNKPEQAIEFLNIALIKDPEYEKAQKLLDKLKFKLSEMEEQAS